MGPINDLPHMKTMKLKDFFVTGLGLTNRVGKITEKVPEISSKITETVKNNLGIAHGVLKKTSFTLSIICLPIAAHSLVKTIKDTPKTKIRNGYDITEITLKLLDATGTLVGSIGGITETTLTMIAKKVGEASIPHFGKLIGVAKIFGRFSTYVSYIMIIFTSVKIARQSLFIIRHLKVKELDGQARFDFWLKHPVSLKRDAGLNDAQIRQIVLFAKQIKDVKKDKNLSSETKKQTDAIAVEMSNLIKNRVWKNMGENGISLTSSVLSALSKPVFSTTLVTAGTAAALGCAMVAGSAALVITNAAVKEVNERSFQNNFTRLFDQVIAAAA